jgi:class 3 adenylate cyclase
MGTLHFQWAWLLPARPEALWPLVSDTNRFNRDAGLPPVEDIRWPGEVLENARRRLRLRIWGVTIEWEELPFEWLRPWRFGVVRRYARGPLREMRVLVTLEEREGGKTLLHYTVAAEPRGLMGMVAAWVQIGIVSRIMFGRVFRRYADQARVETDRPRSAAQSGESSQLPGSIGRRVRHFRKALLAQGVSPALADRLLAHLSEADDLSLARIRPYSLARLWGLPRREVLVLCLRGTRAGVLRLQWDLICPRCLGPKDRLKSLREMRSGSVHCETCQIAFPVHLEESVELSFAPTEGFRRIRAPVFCVAGPQITPHVEVQQLLAPGEVRQLAGILSPGRHRARAWGVVGGPTFMVEPGGSQRVELVVREDGWEPISDPVDPRASLILANRTARERLLNVERTPWADEAVTAAEVTSLQEFRDLFSREVLEAGEFVEIGSLTVVFTDLRGSTRLYREIGDAPAFGKVVAHFERLAAAVARHDGSIVKTIGDAVMAVFRRPADAVRALREAWVQLVEMDPPLILKAGLHHGPCIAVNLNERLDYFGTTVNLAARLGHLSSGADAVCSEAILVDPEVALQLREWKADVERFEAAVRGFDRPVRCARIRWPGADRALIFPVP